MYDACSIVFEPNLATNTPDPAVRLAFVDELPIDDRTTIAAIAREDEDARVRRAAVAKLMAPGAARSDRPRGSRRRRSQQAAAMLRDIALEAFEDIGEAESLEAVDAHQRSAHARPDGQDRDARNCRRARALPARRWAHARIGGPTRRRRGGADARVGIAARARRRCRSCWPSP